MEPHDTPSLRGSAAGASRTLAAIAASTVLLVACGGGSADASSADAVAARTAAAAVAEVGAGSDGADASANADVTANDANATVAGAITAPHPTLQNATIEWAFTGDANANAHVDLQYRLKGASSWNTGMPLRRIAGGSNAGYGWKTRHSGSLFDLQPGTAYEVKLSLVDPDGGSATKTITVKTRPVPVAYAAGAIRRATPSTLANAIAASKPGDIVELSAGHYGNVDWTTDGSPGKPVVLRQTSAGGAVIDGEIYMYQRHDVMLDGLVVNGRIRFNASNFVSITRCTVNARADVGDGIGIVAYLESQDSYIADNVVTGTTTWKESAFGESGDNLGYGIMVGGPGHVIMNNRVSGFRDDISLLDADEAANQYSVDILNNDLSMAGDDAIQADFCWHNCRVMRNRVTNVFMGLSSQPSLGGPTYFVRNVLYNVVNMAFKLYSGSSGNVLLHNTVVKNGDGYAMFSGAPVDALYSRNNLVIGGPGGVYNGYSSGIGRVLEIGDLVVATADMDHDALGSTLGSFAGHYGPKAFSSQPQLESMSTEKHVAQIGLDVFARTILFPALPTSLYATPDLRPKSGGGAVDVGETIPNIDDGFAGAAPDAGAYELGAAMPVYGPR